MQLREERVLIALRQTILFVGGWGGGGAAGGLKLIEQTTSHSCLCMRPFIFNCALLQVYKYKRK